MLKSPAKRTNAQAVWRRVWPGPCGVFREGSGGMASSLPPSTPSSHLVSPPLHGPTSNCLPLLLCLPNVATWPPSPPFPLNRAARVTGHHCGQNSKDPVWPPFYLLLILLTTLPSDAFLVKTLPGIFSHLDFLPSFPA